MPGLTIKPPKPPSTSQASASQGSSFQRRASITAAYLASGQQRPSSPVAPQASPLTPVVEPVFPVFNEPAAIQPTHGFDAGDDAPNTSKQQSGEARRTGHVAQYMPEPASLPFSSEDSTDAIALRAAISALQFQKQNAQQDMRTLQHIKMQAVEDPQHFKRELAAGRLQEQKPSAGDLQAILDHPDSDDEESEAGFGADADGIMPGAAESTIQPASSRDPPDEVPDSQATASRPVTSDGEALPSAEPHSFPHIPGPQNVVRMPYINWDKYHILGEPLERMHRQQQLWPGMPYGGDRGRESVVAAPYSPWQDVIYDQPQHAARVATAGSRSTPSSRQSVAKDEVRKDSGPVSISEHPMETRRTSRNQ